METVRYKVHAALIHHKLFFIYDCVYFIDGK